MKILPHDRSLLRVIQLDPALRDNGWSLLSLGSDGIPDTVANGSLNARLRDGTERLPIRRSGTYVCPSEDVRDAVVGNYRASGKSVFDSLKVRLASDPGAADHVAIEETTYFNGLATNELAVRAIEVAKGGKDMGSVDRAYPHGMVPRLSESLMSNHVGACALAVDADGVLALCVTGSASAVSGGAIAASAAGSLEDSCLNEAADLVEAVSHAIARELREELGLRNDASIRTSVLAFLRGLERGGKPEFVGFVAVEGRWSGLMSDLSDKEAQYTANHLFIDIRSIGVDGMDLWMHEHERRTSYALRSAWWALRGELLREGSEAQAWVFKD